MVALNFVVRFVERVNGRNLRTNRRKIVVAYAWLLSGFSSMRALIVIYRENMGKCWRVSRTVSCLVVQGLR